MKKAPWKPRWEGLLGIGCHGSLKASPCDYRGPEPLAMKGLIRWMMPMG
ncbi:hypothetical protein KEJ36_05475 [Candidatus Bathyarchaeota archaeon]|nr:hypothetical protein [Candidatus Bathyarchaeota archaeon]